ncbi:hypothetical protein A0H81_09269 [Grifola frondosa]|uniref:Uncharacterized protein n=1 Tax=Grifola frondosa TaxID=5627 RepID=A0A1C7M2R7_GRIFR|nr:hypothetical protein A0H81_09269 [Grifola frondosa]
MCREWLVDLTDIKSEQNLLQFWNFTDSWLEDRLGIDSNDTYALKDCDRNHYMFQDFKSYSSPPSRKYLQSVHLSTLAQRPERLIQLGTLFGSSRLHLRNAQNTLVRKHVRQNMAFTNPYLLRTATTIRDALGGLYLGAHIRLGDGLFQENARANVRLTWWKLLHFALKFSKADTLALEQRLFSHDVSAEFSSPPHIALDIPALRVPHPTLDPLPGSATPSLACPGALHTEVHLLPLNTPLFISTDALYPRSDPLLARFRQTFPCTFFLADFSAHTRALDALLNGIDGVTLAPFLLPFLDAMVVGRAWEVVGTEGSTFSAFVQDVLWRTYHGWDIVQRG